MPNKSELRSAAVATTLRSCQLFAGLPTSDIAAVANITLVKALEKEAYLFQEGDSSRGFYIVQKGAISIHRIAPSGKEQVIHVFRTGESFAEGTLGTLPSYPAHARAIEASQVLLVQKAEMLALLRQQPDLALRMLGSMSLRLRTLLTQLEDLTLKDVETRLAHWLLKRCPDASSQRPCTIQLPATKRLLAAELGTVSETFSRTLAKFRAQGLILVRGRSVQVADPSRLAAVLRRNLGE